MVSYLTQREKNQEDRSLNYVLFTVSIVTFINLSITFVSIHLYLRFKHSKSMSVAERSNFPYPRSFMSFRFLLMMFVAFSFCGISNLVQLRSNSYKNFNSVPPNTLILNFLTMLLAMILVIRKRKVIEFVKRKLKESMIFRYWSIFRLRNKVLPENVNKIAWNWSFYYMFFMFILTLK